MVVLRTCALVALAACYSPEIPDCARTSSCIASPLVDANITVDEMGDAQPDARPDAAPMTVALAVRIDGRGDVNIPGVGACSAGNGSMDCPFTVTKGVPLTIGATPKNNWRFDRWEDACSGTAGATCTLTPIGPTSVRARFVEVDD